jgi:hypothetical protein
MGSDFSNHLQTLGKMREQSIELWATNPKVLLPWLEELLKQGKATERVVDVQVQIGQQLPQTLHLAISERLQVEAVLWKAKNPKPAGQ